MTETTTEATTVARRSRARRFFGHPLTNLVAAFLVLALVQGFAVKLFVVPSGSMEHTLEVGDRMLANRLAFGPLTDRTPQRGDVVVFHTDSSLWPKGEAPAESGILGSAKYAFKWFFGDILSIGPGTSSVMVKRVIATGGQTVSCCDAAGRLLVDGIPLDEPYIFEDPAFTPGALDCDTTPISTRCFVPVTVPDGMLLMLGDHRGGSSDGISQCRGTSSSYTSSEANADCARWVSEDTVIGEVFSVVWPLHRFGGLDLAP